MRLSPLALLVAALACAVGVRGAPPALVSGETVFYESNHTVLALEATDVLRLRSIAVGGIPCDPAAPAQNASRFGAFVAYVLPCAWTADRVDVCYTYDYITNDGICYSDDAPCYAAPYGAPCHDTTNATICRYVRCLYGTTGACYELDSQDPDQNVPHSLDGYDCGDGLACSDGACVDNTPQRCNATLVFAPTAPLPAGVHDVVLVDETGATTTWPGAITVVARTVLVGVAPPAASPGTPVALVVSSVPWPVGTEVSVRLVAPDGTPGPWFLNGAPLPEHPSDARLDSAGTPMGLNVTVCYPAPVAHCFAVPPGDLAPAGPAPFRYYRTTRTYSTCPESVLAGTATALTVFGDGYTNTSALACEFVYAAAPPDGGAPAANATADAPATVRVPARYESSRIVTCNLTLAPDVASAVVVGVTVDGATVARAPQNVTIRGSCAQVKPHSTPLDGACVCDPGYAEAAGGTACEPCPDGTYQPERGRPACIPCNADGSENTGGTTGNTAAAACRCRDGRMRLAPDAPGCDFCLVGLVCQNGTSTLTAGYWRVAPDSTRIVACPVGVGNCAGGAPAGNAACAHGYHGPACGVCDAGFAPAADGTCVRCDSLAESRGLAALALAAALVAGAAVVRYSGQAITPISDRAPDMPDVGTALRIALDHLQTLYMMSRIGVAWSPAARGFFAMLVPLTLSPTQGVLACALEMRFYARMALVLATPLALVAAVALVYAALHLACRARPAVVARLLRAPCRQDAAVTAAVVVALLHQTLVFEVLRSLHCAGVPAGPGGATRFFVDGDAGVACNTPAYARYRAVAGAYLAVYFAAWLGFFAWMRGFDDRIATALARRVPDYDGGTFGFFISGLRAEYYLWEGAAIARRTLLGFALVFAPIGIQLLAFVVILGAHAAATVNIRPYRFHSDNRLAVAALAALFVTAVLVDGIHISGVSTAAFACIVLANALALALAIFEVLLRGAPAFFVHHLVGKDVALAPLPPHPATPHPSASAESYGCL